MAIITKLLALGVEFKISYLDRIGHPDDKMQIILLGNSHDDTKAIAALRQEGLLETKTEMIERLVAEVY